MPLRTDGRPDPDRLLKLVQAEERESARGRLKVFLGYASGIGKSFRMLDEGRRRKDRGQDVIIGALQPKMEPAAEALLKKFENLPPRIIDGVPVIDVDAILARHPQVCLIDGLAYNNPAGCRNAKRWQDVNTLLDAGIAVVTSINLQYIEEYREQVERITGKQVSQTVPEAFLQTADEIAIVDTPPEFAVLKAGQSESALSIEEFESKLSELREMALLVAADVVDRQLTATLNASGIADSCGAQERILVCLTPRTNASRIIASASRNVKRFHGELFAISVTQPETSPEDREALRRNLDLAHEAGAQVELLDAVDPAEAILNFARAHSITQIMVGHSRRQGWTSRFVSTPVDRLIENAGNIDVRIFPN